MLIHLYPSLIVTGILLSGCNIVVLREPLGREIPMERQKMLEGEWTNEDGKHFEVRAASDGLKLGTLAWDECSDEFAASTQELVATESGGMTFLYLKFKEDDEMGFLFCWYVQAHEDQILLYYPTVPAFEKAVVSRKLEGSVTRTEHSTGIYIGSPGTAVIEVLRNDGTVYFDEQPTMTLKRLKP